MTNLFCPFCGYPLTGHQLPLPEGTTCPHCSAAVTTQDISPHFGAFDPKPYLVKGRGPDGQEVTVRVTAVGELGARIMAEKAGIVTPIDVRLEPPPQPPPVSWWQRVNVREHLLYAVLFAVVPGVGWVAAGWKVTGSVFGALGAVVANYLVLRLTFALSSWIARKHHGPERLAQIARLALPARTPPAPKEPSVGEFIGNFACAAVTLLVIRDQGTFIGSLVGIGIMWPLAVFSRADQVKGTHVVACYALYFLAGVSSIPRG